MHFNKALSDLLIFLEKLATVNKPEVIDLNIDKNSRSMSEREFRKINQIIYAELLRQGNFSELLFWVLTEFIIEKPKTTDSCKIDLISDHPTSYKPSS